MSKTYKDFQDKPLQASEPAGTYGVRTDAPGAPLQQDTMIIESARKMSPATLRREYALQHDMTVEELYDVIADEIDSIYANG